MPPETTGYSKMSDVGGEPLAVWTAGSLLLRPAHAPAPGGCHLNFEKANFSRFFPTPNFLGCSFV